MTRSTALLLLCTAATPAVAHAPGDQSLIDAARHLLLGSHHLAATVLALVVLAGVLFALGRRRPTQLVGRNDRKR